MRKRTVIKALQVTNMYPRKDNPANGIFVKEQIDSLASVDIETKVFVIEGFKGKKYYLKSVPELRKVAMEFKPDLMHSHYGFSGVVSLLSCCGLNIPQIVSFCGSDVLGTPADYNGKNTKLDAILVGICRYSAAHFKEVIVKSNQMKDMVIGWNEKAKVIPNGVLIDKFRIIDKKYARTQLGLDPNKKYVLFGGSPKVMRKNFPLARESLQLAKKQIKHLEMLVLENIARDEVPLYLNSVNCLLLTSLWEGSPNIVKEAMSCGIPIVSTNSGDIEWLFNGVEGHYLGDNTEDLARKIILAVKREDRTNGSARISELGLEMNQIAKRIKEVYLQSLKLKNENVK